MTATDQRTNYQERWADFTPEQKARVTGGDKEVIAELDRMAAGKFPGDRETLLAELREETPLLGPQIDGLQAHLNTLLLQRRLNFAKRLMLGDPVTGIARDYGKSSMVVSYDTGISKKTR